MKTLMLSNDTSISDMLYDDLVKAFRKSMELFNVSEFKDIYERTSIMMEIPKKHTYFDINEQTIIKAFVDDPPDKTDFIDKIIKQLPDITDENMKDLIIGIIMKVVNMTDEQFAKIDLSKALDSCDFC